MFAVWLALLPRMVRSVVIAWCMMNWKRVRHCRPSGWRDTSDILWFAILPNITAGLVTEITRALSIGDSGHRRAGRIFRPLGARASTLPNGGHVGDALELSMSRRGPLCFTRRGDNLQCFTGKACSRWGFVVRLLRGWNNAVTGYPQSHH